MKTCMKLMIVSALGGALLVGCGEDAPILDFPVRETIWYTDDDNQRAELPTPDINGMANMPGNGTAGGTACLTDPTNIRPPETTADISVAMTVLDFETDDPVGNVVVQFYRDNVFPEPGATGFSCEATDNCQMGTSDATGLVPPFMDAGDSWYSYFIRGRSGPTPASTPVDSAQYNESASATITGNSVAASTLSIIPTVLGLTRVTGTALVAGTVYDCADEPVRGLVIRMFSEGPTETFIADAGTRTGPGYRYFNGDGFPDGDQGYTNVDGLFAAANLPVAAPLRVEAWYNAGTATAPVPTLWGCERIRVFPNGVTIVNIRPKRMDITGCTL